MKRLAPFILAALLCAGCSSVESQLPSANSACSMLTSGLGATAGGVAGAFLAGNSVKNSLTSTSNGTTAKVTVTKKNASNGTTALYTGGGALLTGGIASIAGNYLCPVPAVVTVPTKMSEIDRNAFDNCAFDAQVNCHNMFPSDPQNFATCFRNSLNLCPVGPAPSPMAMN